MRAVACAHVNWVPFAVAAGLLALVCLWVALTYNQLHRLRYACDDAWSLTEVQLQRRAYLVPNLVATVQAYAQHEQAVLQAVTAARAAASPLHDPSPEHAAVQARLGQSVGAAIALAEQYPDLKASTQFQALQATLSDLEDQIAASREIYNSNVTRYRAMVQQVPSSLVARRFGFEDRAMFAEPERKGGS